MSVFVSVVELCFLSKSDWRNAVSKHPESKIGLVQLLKFGKVNELV